MNTNTYILIPSGSICTSTRCHNNTSTNPDKLVSQKLRLSILKIYIPNRRKIKLLYHQTIQSIAAKYTSEWLKRNFISISLRWHAIVPIWVWDYGSKSRTGAFEIYQQSLGFQMTIKSRRIALIIISGLLSWRKRAKLQGYFSQMYMVLTIPFRANLMLNSNPVQIARS